MKKKTIVGVIVAVIILVVFTGCIGEDKEMEEEKEVIQLIVEQSYPKIEGEFSLPFNDECKQILESVGFEVVDEKATQYDYTLLVEITGEPLGDKYLGSGLLYTGAIIDGSFSLSGPNMEITKSFHEEKPCPGIYTYFSKASLPKKPSDAPFRYLHWEKHLFLLLYDIWGIEPILEAVDEKEIDVRESAAEALGEIGPNAKEAIPTLIDLLQDREVYIRKSAANALGEIGSHAKEAVPALINALEDEDEYVRKEVVRALKKITGEDLGEDPSKWQEWWEENK